MTFSATHHSYEKNSYTLRANRLTTLLVCDIINPRKAVDAMSEHYFDIKNMVDVFSKLL